MDRKELKRIMVRPNALKAAKILAAKSEMTIEDYTSSLLEQELYTQQANVSRKAQSVWAK